jgi:hypothetical protein
MLVAVSRRSAFDLPPPRPTTPGFVNSVSTVMLQTGLSHAHASSRSIASTAAMPLLKQRGQPVAFSPTTDLASVRHSPWCGSVVQEKHTILPEPSDTC